VLLRNRHAAGLARGQFLGYVGFAVNHPLYLPLLAALLAPAQGLELRNYNPGRHNRFSSGFPGNPVMNPTFLHDASKFTGVEGGTKPGIHPRVTRNSHSYHRAI